MYIYTYIYIYIHIYIYIYSYSYILCPLCFTTCWSDREHLFLARFVFVQHRLINVQHSLSSSAPRMTLPLIHTCVYIYTYICTYYACLPVFTTCYTYICIYISIYVYTYMNIYVCVYLYTMPVTTSCCGRAGAFLGWFAIQESSTSRRRVRLE